MNTTLFSLVLLPLLIFLARIMDVSIGTIRIILIGRGNKIVAPILGFFEVLIWLIAIQQIMQNLSNALYYIAYAAGFAAGNFIGMYIEEKLAMGVFLVRIITVEYASKLIDHLRRDDYGVTVLDAEGLKGEVNVIYTIVKRTDIKTIISIIDIYNPKAFYSIEDVRFVSEGVFPAKSFPFRRIRYRNLLKRIRKKK